MQLSNLVALTLSLVSSTTALAVPATNETIVVGIDQLGSRATIVGTVTAADVGTVIANDGLQKRATTQSYPIGCYDDNPNYRTLRDDALYSDDMTIDKCQAYCASKSSAYNIFGVEYGRECYCGSGLRNGATTTGTCTMPCAGDSSMTCGGGKTLSVYTTNYQLAVSVFASPQVSQLGCFQDFYGSPTNYRALDGADYESDSMTMESCSAFCNGRGYAYGGVEYGRECYCGSTAPSVTSTGCTMTCGGNANEICGGGNAINVFQNKFSVPVPVGVVAVLSADIFTGEVVNQLVASGRFKSVDYIDVRGTSAPTAATLAKYSSVLVYSDYRYGNPTGLGNALADYVDTGRRVVTATFNFELPLGLQGRFLTQNYDAFTQVNDQTQGTRQTLVKVLPNDPLLANVNSFDGGESSYRIPGRITSSGATLVASWSSGDSLVAKKPGVGGAGSVVALNFFPPSSNSRSDLWNINTDGTVLLANALLN